MDLDLWDCFGRKKVCLITEEIRYHKQCYVSHAQVLARSGKSQYVHLIQIMPSNWLLEWISSNFSHDKAFKKVSHLHDFGFPYPRSRTQGSKVTLRGLRGHLLHTVTFHGFCLSLLCSWNYTRIHYTWTAFYLNMLKLLQWQMLLLVCSNIV